MTVDPSSFHTVNVTDTCAVWNVLSSRLLHSTSRAAGCSFCCTHFVYYECLHKHRNNPKNADKELQDRFSAECKNSGWSVHHLDIDDLQDVAVLERRKRLSKGELSSIAFARKIRQAVLTDDQRARKLASEVMEPSMVQTTPHLFGWLIFTGLLGDSDKVSIIEEHDKYKGSLAPHFNEIYHRALKYRLMSRGNAVAASQFGEKGTQAT